MDSILNYERSEDEEFYAILGCDERSTTEQINAEYKQRVLHCHPDKHPGDQTAADRFEKLQRAKFVLTDPDERKHYDAWKAAGICMPYRQWRALRDKVHMVLVAGRLISAFKASMHWGVRKQMDPMLEAGQESSTAQPDVQDGRNSGQPDTISEVQRITQDNIPWQRDTPSESLRRFRNYEI